MNACMRTSSIVNKSVKVYYTGYNSTYSDLAVCDQLLKG